MTKKERKCSLCRQPGHQRSHCANSPFGGAWVSQPAQEFVKKKSGNNMRPINRDLNNFWTPDFIFEYAEEMCGNPDKDFKFDIDLAADSENTKCEKYFTKDDNAMFQDWGKYNWCNPPYSNIEPFIEKAILLVCFYHPGHQIHIGLRFSKTPTYYSLVAVLVFSVVMRSKAHARLKGQRMSSSILKPRARRMMSPTW